MKERSAEALAAITRQLGKEWRGLNYTRLRNALREPVIELTEGTRQLGRWQRTTRTIGLSTEFVFTAPWGHVREVLKHEMAHQYAHEVLGATDERPHGSAFQRAADALGVDPRAAGELTETVSGEREAVMRRIRKLLALAGSDNRFEAEAAMGRAQRLMLEHNVSLGAEAPRYVWRHIGPSKQRFAAWEKMLAGLLGRHFFVSVVWANTFLVERGVRGRVLEINGSPENVDFAEHAHDFLRYTAGRLWREHKSARGIRSNRDRQRFLAGVISGFGAKLQAASEEATERGLVWVPDAGLAEHVARRHPRLVAGRRSRLGWSGFAEGRAAGGTIELHRPVAARATRRALTGPTD